MGDPTADKWNLSGMEGARVISSSDLLDDVEHHFRVFAGPGAGKSYWLIRHIRNVLRTSRRLSGAGRIACISYTNTAVDEIAAGLGDMSDRVEVSTIHSFLYRFIVKPNLHFLIADDGTPLVAYHLVKRHDVHRPSFSRVQEWVRAIGKAWLLQGKFERQRNVLFAKLRELIWDLADDGTWTLRPRNTDMMGPGLIDVCSTANLQEYKRRCWQSGILDHEDVLYFAHELLESSDTLRQCMSARFRYLFIDEFQDTHPVQSKMVERLAANGTVCGVIGDEQQSIYRFLGAMPKHFTGFALPGAKDYRIEENRRSTGRIIKLLNHVRGDKLQQKAHRNDEGQAVQVVCADVHRAVAEITQTLGESEVQILTRTNKEAACIRHLGEEDVTSVWNEFAGVDSERAVFFEHLVAAGVLAGQRQFGMAVQTMERALIGRKGIREPLRSEKQLSDVAGRGLAVSLVEYVLSHRELLDGSTIGEAYKALDQHVLEQHGVTLKKVRTGAFQTFAQNTQYGALVAAVQAPEERRPIRNIHQAKGTEWPNVIVWFSESTRLAHVLNPNGQVDDNEQEERRVTYVALSRARDRLFVVVPELSDEEEAQCLSLGLDVSRSDS